MQSPDATPGPFVVKDCALLAIATGLRAQNLRELRDQLLSVHPGCIYYHVWGGLLRPRFDDPEFNNDFAAWARHGLHEHTLAERLGVIDPSDFRDVEALRRELIEVVEQRLAESEFVPWAKADEQFHFVRAQTMVFNTPRRIHHPRELPAAVPLMSVGSIYYHVIDARWRVPKSVDDFRAWLAGFGTRHADLIEALAGLDPYFCNLTELRRQLAELLREYFRRTDD